MAMKWLNMAMRWLNTAMRWTRRKEDVSKEGIMCLGRALGYFVGSF